MTLLVAYLEGALASVGWSRPGDRDAFGLQAGAVSNLLLTMSIKAIARPVLVDLPRNPA